MTTRTPLEKTPLEIAQELIAIHTTRIEMVERFSVKALTPDAKVKLRSARQQSEKYSKELMTELSKSGDAVMPGVGNQNEYQVAYKNELGKIDAMTPDEAEQMFASLEKALKTIYQTILKTQINLPTSLQEVLKNQFDDLKVK